MRSPARTFPLIVFDLDGTLVDSLGDLADAANELLSTLDSPPLDQAAIGRMVGDGVTQLVERVLAAAAVTVDPTTGVDRFREIYDRRLLMRTAPYPGVVPTLERLSRLSRLAVLTNKPRAASEQVLRGLELERFFGAIVGGDGPFPRKPDPAGLHHLAGQAGVTSSDVLLVGDSPVDLYTARRAGAAICIARYGFGAAAFSSNALETSDFVIDELAQLATSILE